MVPEPQRFQLDPRAVGTGRDQWWTRVECYVTAESDELRREVSEGLDRILPGRRSERSKGYGLDWGTGMATPVVGMTFRVLADSPGEAAALAVTTALKAAGSHSIRLYGFTLITEPGPDEGDPEFPVIDD